MKEDRGKFDDTIAAMFSNVRFSSSYLFYAHMIGQCSVKINNDLPAPAGVSFHFDHYNLHINPQIFSEYTLLGRLAILKHEMLHILEGHLLRLEDREMETWNIATDCAINQHIDEDHLPSDGITPETLKKHRGISVPPNRSSENYYDLIKKDAESDQEDGQAAKGSGKELKPMDSHETWGISEGDPDLQKDITRKMLEKAQEETLKIGNVPSELSRWMEILSSKSEVNWKKVLRGIVGNKRASSRKTIMRSDRRLPNREDLKGKTRDRVFNLLVISDISGSMKDESLLRTLGEVRHVCDVTKTDVDMIQVDVKAYPPEKLSKKSKLFQRKGSGGTFLSNALDVARDHRLDFQAVVVLTDGGLAPDDVNRFGDLRKKVIWLIEPNGHTIPEMEKGKMRVFKLRDT